MKHLAGAALVCSVVLAAACGGSPPTPTVAPPPPSPPTAAAAAAPTRPVAPTPAPAPTAAAETAYVVKAGDTLWGIAQLYGVGVDAIVQANNLTDSGKLSVGQRLNIPVKK